MEVDILYVLYIDIQTRRSQSIFIQIDIPHSCLSIHRLRVWYDRIESTNGKCPSFVR